MTTLHQLIAAGLLLASISPRLIGQQFTNVTTSVGFVQEKQKPWGNPIWGDINNDGYLHLIIPTHGLLASGGPFVYLNNCGQSFSDIRSTCGIKHNPSGSRDDGDWHGYAFVHVTLDASSHYGSTSQSPRRGRSSGEVCGYRHRRRAVELSVAEKWRRHSRRESLAIHYPGDYYC